MKYLWQFIVICLLQVLLFNNLMLGGYINPFPYIYFILILPITIGRIPLLLIGFVLGLIMDMFADTGGIHAAATTLIAYYRPLLLKARSPREGYELQAVPHIKVFGFGWFFSYAAILVFLHHTVLFFLEVFRFAEFFRTLLKVFLSGSLSITLIILAEFLFVSNRRR